MLKKFSLFWLCLIVAACSGPRATKIADTGGSQAFNTDISEINIAPINNSFRVGVLLPLSGAASKHGRGMKNATMIALEDVKNPNLILQYYDTKSTPSGARIAVANAIRQRSNLIIGPLMSSEVQAIANETIYQGVPVIAFSTAQEVLQPTVYTMGLLVEEQVDRIMTFAAQKGRRRFALLLPDNSNGIAVAKAAVKSAQKNGVEVTVIGFYPPATSDFSSIIKQMTNYNSRHAKAAGIKNSLKARANAGDEAALRELKRMETSQGVGDLDFDAVIIPESGAKLTSAISMFAYYDASYPQIQFLGTSIWETGKFNKESTIVNSWYPAISRKHSSYFANKYYNIFGERPSSLYSFAYDAVALANELSKQQTNNLNMEITNPDGYAGINGAFRFFDDGSNQHSLDIVEIRSEGDVVIDEAPQRFEDDGSGQRLQPVNLNGYNPPKIYGKDAATAQIAIFGSIVPQGGYYPSSAGSEDFEVVIP